jgi:predicted MarR family transcription regulator
LEKIEKGGSSPSDLNQGINHLSRGWSQAMVNTIRAGAISRLNELGLINRLRNGVNVTYSLTKFGKEILSTLKEKQGGI